MIGDRGDKPVRNLITELGGWPVIDDQWSSSGFVLEDMLSKIRGKYEAPYLFNIGVGADDKNSTANIIQIDQATLGMPSREYYMHRNQAHLQAYVRFMSDVVRLMGATGPDVTSQLNDLLDFETKLANVSSTLCFFGKSFGVFLIVFFQTTKADDYCSWSKLVDNNKVFTLHKYHSPVSLAIGRLILAFLPQFDVLRYLRGFIQDPITEDEPIVVFALQYLKDVVDIVEETEPRTVANYIIWRVVQHFVEYLDESFQEARSLYKQVFQGVKQDLIRWKRCVEIVNENVGMATGAMFVRDNFKKQSKDTLNFTGDQFFDNILSVLEFETRRSLDRLRKEVRKDVWEQEPVVVNAFYNPNTNDIVFPAGILQPSFYSQSYPKSLNYGGIGVVIGHEITHGFDDKGRQYDKNGNIKLWWDDKTIEAFRKRAQCVIEQYSGFKLEQINEYLFLQIWCGKTRDEEALRKSRISVHSPGSIRVLGPLSNSREFSAAYSCPLGSRMNPEHKCSVW
ncbi:neprilysin-1 [Aplysia californica]|uniref:Neprilysin-1 n=1 Tax=Aplysia californica TaxID=6500 RepID=A0ABM1W4X8_APLCA|nr:neprilysin-1 [Aplysia californica]